MTDNAGGAGWQQIGIRTLPEVQGLINHLLEEIRLLCFTDKERFGIRLALEEALVNAIKHGNRQDPDKSVHIRFQITPHQFLIEIKDEGRGFDPDAVPDPLHPTNLERPGGRGVFLMRHYMCWVQYNEVGNCVTLCKTRKLQG
jgi:serine/threonine-protein kinase RsbW